MTDEEKPVKRTKTIDEIFCKSCGEPIKKEAEICPHCGVLNEALKSKNKSVDNKNWFKKSKIAQVVTLFFIVVFIIGFIDGYTNSTSNFLSGNTDLIYTQNTADMVLTIEDMPSKWHDRGTNPTLYGKNASSSFINTRGLLPTTFGCKVSKYDSIEESKTVYQKIYADFKTETPMADFMRVDIGQSSYCAEYGGGLKEETVFRKGNIVVEITSSLGTSTIKYAKIVHNKIDPDQGHVETVSPIQPIQTEISENVYNLKVGSSIDIDDGNKFSAIEIDNDGTEVFVELIKNDGKVDTIVLNVGSQWDTNGYRIEIISINQSENSIDFLLS